MEQLQRELFLGFHVTPHIEMGLKKVSPSFLNIFLSESVSHYLTFLKYQHEQFIGKFIGDILDFSQFDFFEANIYSIASRLLTDFKPQAHPLQLFAAQRNPLPLKDVNF